MQRQLKRKKKIRDKDNQKLKRHLTVDRAEQSTDQIYVPAQQFKVKINQKEGVLLEQQIMTKDKTPQSVILPKSAQQKQDWKRVIVVIQKANLELIKTKSGIEIINSDDHKMAIKKLNKSYEDYRPDITHQCLLSLLDSPLNKAGKLQIFIHTAQGILIQLSPKLRLPRTFKRFSGVMAQCLKKFRIRAAKSSDTLMRVVKNPVTDHFPINIPKISLSTQGRLVNINKYIRRESLDKTCAFVIGGVSTGNPTAEVDYKQDLISISNYSLTASNCCSKLTDAYQNLWGIL